MKRKIILLLFTITIGLNVYAADYRPLVEDGKVWHMAHSVYGFPEYIYDFDYIIQGDTVISGLEAKKVYCINEDNTGAVVYKLALREEDKKVLFIPPGSEQQYVLYDFNGKVGDEVTIAKEIIENPDNMTMKIIAKQTMRSHNYNRHAYLMMRAEDEVIDWSCCGWWIEGIGSTLGPFNAWRFGYTGMLDGLISCEVNDQCVYESIDWMHLDDEYWKGNVDGSGIVDVSDVNAAINIILKLKTVGDYPGNGDMDGNGYIDVEDVNVMINIILKL